MGVKGFIGGVKKVASFTKGYTGGTIRGMSQFWRPGFYKSEISNLTSAVRGVAKHGLGTDQLIQMGKASAALLGAGSGIMLTSRLIRRPGENPLRDKRGRINVPLVPFI